MTISQIRSITVFVSDQDKAKDFYANVLGFTVRGDRQAGDTRWLEVAPADSGTAIVLHQPFPGATAGTSSGVILTSADVDADVAAIRAAGGDVEGPEDLPWGRQATVKDPDGNTFVVSTAG